jgi:hypothetical protein
MLLSDSDQVGGLTLAVTTSFQYVCCYCIKLLEAPLLTAARTQALQYQPRQIGSSMQPQSAAIPQ